MLNRRRPAFTLVELMIVIGIIVVLVAILVPAVGSAKRMAQRTACQNNVRALLMATQQYVINDAEGRLPYPNYGGAANGGPGKNWDDPAKPGWLYTWPNYGNTPDDMKTGTLWKYLQDERVYHCPLQNTSDAVVSSKPQPSLNITSYLVNCAVCGFCRRIGAPSYVWTGVRKPSESVFLFECAPYGRDVATGAINTNTPADYFNDGSGPPQFNSLSDRHGTGASVGFLDWHVEYYDFTAYQFQLAQHPGPFNCNPDLPTGD